MIAAGKALLAGIGAGATVMTAQMAVEKINENAEEIPANQEVADACSTCGGGRDNDKDKDKDSSGASKQDKKLSKGELKKLEEAGHHPHDLKPKIQGSRYDLFKNRNGDILVKPKNGSGPGDPTGLNINNL